MARVKLGIDTLADLAAQNYLKPADVEAAHCAYEFILRVRNELHFISGLPPLGLTARHISAATVMGQPAVGSGVAVAASQSA